jgi:hypothetical protein
METLTKQTIQKFIIDNHKKMTNDEMATKLNVTKNVIGANYASLKRHKIIGDRVEKAQTKNTKVKQGSAFFGKEKSFEGANKIKTREFINQALTVRRGLIGCLPSKKAELEQLILKTTPKGIDFVAHEWNDDIYFELTKLISEKQLPISANRGAINKWLMKLTENELSNLILDYCGCLNTFKTEIEHCFDNKVIGVDGIVAMTFCLNDVHYQKGVIGEMFESINENFFSSGHSKIQMGIMLYMNNILNKDKNKGHYKVERVFQYSDKNPDTNKGMSMVLIIVRRVK